VVSPSTCLCGRGLVIRVATVARAVLVHVLKLMLAATRRPIIVRRASGKSVHVHCPHAIGLVRLDGDERDIEAGDELDSECSHAGAQRDDGRSSAAQRNCELN
jgi:hypothetical protein